MCWYFSRPPAHITPRATDRLSVARVVPRQHTSRPANRNLLAIALDARPAKNDPSKCCELRRSGFHASTGSAELWGMHMSHSPGCVSTRRLQAYRTTLVKLRDLCQGKICDSASSHQPKNGHSTASLTVGKAQATSVPAHGYTAPLRIDGKGKRILALRRTHHSARPQ